MSDPNGRGHDHAHAPAADETIYYLRLAPYLTNLSDGQIEALRPEVIQVHYGPEELIFREGGTSPGLCLVKRGRVRIYRTSKDGAKEQTIRVIRPGEPFNDVPLFDGGPNPTSAQALEETDLLVLPPGPLLKLMKSDPGVAIAATKVLAQRLRQLSSLVDDLLFE